MKKIFISITFLSLLTVFYSCERDLETEGVSRITTYAVLTINGAADTILPLNATWADPGILVSTGDAYTTSGSVNTAVAGRYVLTYKAVNVDGFAALTERTVWVLESGDATIDYSGTYQGGRGSTYSNSTGGDGTVVLTPISGIPGTYICSDMFARYYEVFRAYGMAYRCYGMIRIVDATTFDNAGANVTFDSPWGDGLILPGTSVIEGSGRLTYRLGWTDGSSVAASFFLEPTK